MTLTVVILTKNEAVHIERAINSVSTIADRLFVIDSGSSDETTDIADSMGATVLSHPFVNQAKQFNWALNQLPSDTDWVFRLDADEIVSTELRRSLKSTLPTLGADIAGAEIGRRIAFMGKPIRWGGVFPVSTVRVLRYGRGCSDDRWMDEHIVVDGAVAKLEGELLDSNLNPISWWIDKHNRYASREVVEILDETHNFLDRPKTQKVYAQNTRLKHWVKKNVYGALPGGVRAMLYFMYRYLFLLGFLDGRTGTIFHVLQGFWYRYLVDVKLHEVRRYAALENTDVQTAIQRVLGIDVSHTN